MIFETLKINNSLKKLKLNNNHLVDDAITVIEEVLGINKILTHLKLANNLISKESVNKGLKPNKTLEVVDPTKNGLYNKNKSILENGYRYNFKILILL